jgi:hypothetical protein
MKTASTMQEVLLKNIKRIYVHIESCIVQVVFLSFVAAYGGLLVVSKKVSDFSLQLANTPTPLWATIALSVLCCYYMWQKKSSKNPSTSYVTHLYKIEKFKWKVHIYKNGKFSVDDIPYCPNHDLQFVSARNGEVFYCPECKGIVVNENIRFDNKAAISIIERAVMRRELKY